MLKTLYGRLAVVLFGLFLLIGVLFVLIARYAFDLYQNEANQRFNYGLAAQIAAESTLMHGPRVDQQALKQVFMQIMAVNPSIEIYLLDPAGRVLAYSAPPGKVQRMQLSLKPIQSFLSAPSALPILGDDPRNPSGKKVFSAAPITSRGVVQGYLYVILGGEEYTSLVHMLQNSYIARLSLWTIAAGLVFAFAAGLILFAVLTRRLKRLGASVEQFHASDFSLLPAATAATGRTDELDRLEHRFQEMGRHIIRQMEKLKGTDRLRRELIANVSHDLRTPLAAIQGYIETLLGRFDTLSPEEHRHYLTIAHKHSERLGKLVAELFQLAKLDAQEVKLRREPFAIADLVQDIAQEFHLSAEQKDIELDIHHNGENPQVLADIALIERVLENLIENALRYTPPHGRVRLTLSNEANHVRIDVADSGCGIPEDELANIFDRFYRAANNTTALVDGAGLGLAIAKRILDLHGSPMTVASRPESGTIFSFTLPRYSAQPPHKTDVRGDGADDRQVA